jgi:hypothetical protein
VTLTALERVILTAWVGSLWTTGFLVAPVLFAMLPDRVLAGEVAGRLFGHVDWMGLVCASLLLFSGWWSAGGRWFLHWRAWCLLAMLAIALINRAWLAPQMRSLKQAAGGVPVQDTPLAADFASLHMVSGSLFVVASLLGLLLVAAGPRTPRPAA